jgi:hypothetical protein
MISRSLVILATCLFVAGMAGGFDSHAAEPGRRPAWRRP